MKYPVAYYLLLIYIVTICQPIIPWVQDVLAHTFNETEHIATVHHQNGRAHFHYELEKLMTKTNGNDNQSVNDNFYSNVPLHTPVTCEFIFQLNPQKVRLSFNNLAFNLPIAFLAINIPPPRL